MSPYEQELERELNAIRTAGLWRQLLRVDSAQSPRLSLNGETLLNFSSNDYLGLADRPELKRAACAAVAQFGTGCGSARLICGSLAPHHELEDRLAQFKGTAAALSFSSGYAAAVGAIGALVGREDVIVLDRLVHASIVDAARLSGAKLRVFAHNDPEDLQRILQWADRRRASAPVRPGERQTRVLVVTESVFSMDGDLAPLAEIVRLKEQYGAWLMLDEAHATGLFGPNRRGYAESCGLSALVEVQMGTLGKAFGSAGGYLCGSRQLVDLLINRARSFIFSTAPVPAAAAAASAGVDLVASPAGAELCALTWRRIAQFTELTRKALPELQVPSTSAILPIVIGQEQRTLAIAERLRSAGIFVPAIRFPTVARGQARLRITLSAKHSLEAIQELVRALALALNDTA